MTGPLENPHALPSNTHLSNGNYVIQQVIGVGGFSIAYLAFDQTLHRRVAIKEFFPEGCFRVGQEVQPPQGGSAEVFQEARNSFIFEARNLARFRHPNIVTAHAFFEENNTAYLVMEYLEGKTLREIVGGSGALGVDKAVEIIQKAGAALCSIHESESAKFLHRDVNPNNIMMCNDGRVVLMDFGLTQVLEETKSYQTRLLRDTPVFFTPGFAAPEQYKKDAQLTQATDVYGLAATLYYLITGNVPLDAQSRWMGAIDTLPEIRVFQPSISEAINNGVKQAMAEKPENRPQSVKLFLELVSGGQTSAPDVKPAPITPTVAPAKINRQASAPDKSFKFSNGSAASLAELIALCERFPDEAREYFTDGSLANWVGGTLGESLLAGHIQGARQDVIRNLSGATPSARAEAQEIRRGTEIMMRHLYGAAGKASFPKIVAYPDKIALGTIVSGSLEVRNLRLANQGRGDAWGTVEVSPPSPAVQVTPTFANLDESLEIKVDTSKYIPENYVGNIVIRGEGVPSPCKVPLSFSLDQLKLKLEPPQVNLGKVRCGTTANANVSLSWEPREGRLVGAVYRLYGDNLENREFYSNLDGTDTFVNIRITAPVLAVRFRPYKEVYRLVTNAGNFDIPVEYKVAVL